MTNKTLALLVLAGVSLALGPGTRAQSQSSSTGESQAGVEQDVNLMRQDVRSQKKQLIAANLKLTDTEATRFWPVYDRYTADLTKINDRRYALLKEYSDDWNAGNMTSAQATSLISRALATDEQIAQLRSRYVPIFNQAVPGTKTATFFQLDRRIQDIIDLQLASQIPLVQEQQ